MNVWRRSVWSTQATPTWARFVACFRAVGIHTRQRAAIGPSAEFRYMIWSVLASLLALALALQPGERVLKLRSC